jgi:hypothetical protein
MARSKAKPKKGLKRGMLAKEDKAFIAHHKDRHTSEQIAGRLRRPVSTVKKFLETLEPPRPEAVLTMTLAEELQTRPEWANFREQFTDAELQHFKYRYVQLMGQFRDEGILPTEEMQLYEVIRLDILIQRTMTEQKQMHEEMHHAHQEIERIRKEFEENGDPSRIDESRTHEIAYAKAAAQVKDLSARYDSYMMRQSAMLKELKATRDQRVRVLENSRQSFLGFLRMLNEEDQRDAIGREAGLMAAAADVAAEKLRRPHTYADGMTDQPLLTPEDVRDY